MRRAMSSPRPVDPAAAGARARARPAGTPGPRSLDGHLRAPAVPGPDVTAKPCPPACGRRRCRAARRPRPPGRAAGDADRAAARRRPIGSSPALVVGQHATRSVSPVSDDRASRRSPRRGPRAPAGGPRDHLVDAPAHARPRRPAAGRGRAAGRPSASSRSAVSGVRSRWARSAAASRSAVSSSPIRPASRLTAVAHLPHLRRPGRRRPGRQVAAAQPVRRGRQIGDRPGQRPGQPVGHEQRQDEQDEAEPGQHQPGPGHARRAAASVGHEHLDRRRCRRPAGPAAPGGCRRRADSTAAARGRLVVARGSGRARASCRRSTARPTRAARVRSVPTTFAATSRPLVEADRGDEDLHLHLGGVQRARLGDPRHQGGRGQQEGQQHDRGGRRDQQGDLAPHGSGSASRTPTPRTVCSSRGSAALSPSLRRSQDRWTSTVLSAPP